MRLDIWYIALALVFLLAGEFAGEWMARSHDHSAALIHSHLVAVGWASFAVFGLIHRSYPTLRDSRIALAQFLLASASAVIFVGGMWVMWMIGDPWAAIVGAYGLIAATLMFVIMFFGRVVFAKVGD
jgi:hypothetical protein